jgi:rSAM/selenodomain-associated transferase 2
LWWSASLSAFRFAQIGLLRSDLSAAALKPRLSIIVPILNEAAGLPSILGALLSYQKPGCEVLLVDGGSKDDSVAIARSAGFKVLISERGRALQMNAGAQASQADVLLFLHADTVLPESADLLILDALEGDIRQWGRFNVRITGRSPMLAVVAWLMNLRSAWTGIATGDQAIFVRRQVFQMMGGFPQQSLMEDIEFSKRIKTRSRPICLYQKVSTSGRRWETKGVWRTIVLMWRLRLAYYFGADPAKLAERYRR